MYVQLPLAVPLSAYSRVGSDHVTLTSSRDDHVTLQLTPQHPVLVFRYCDEHTAAIWKKEVTDMLIVSRKRHKRVVHFTSSCSILSKIKFISTGRKSFRHYAKLFHLLITKSGRSQKCIHSANFKNYFLS